MPPNVRIHEIFCKAGSYSKNPEMQQNYISSNYTHVVRDCATNNNRIVANMLARKETNGNLTYSLSCNADNTIEGLQEFRKAQQEGEKRLAIGMVNSELPFMYGDAEVTPDAYDVIIDTGEGDQPLFSTPRLPVADPDHMLGLHVSTLIKDGGTLQIGIGALGDAIAASLDMRQNNNEVYRKVVQDAGITGEYSPLIDELGGTGTFEKGIYGSTEMLVDAFIQLYKSDVIKRRVYHHIGIQTLINQGLLTDEIRPDTLKLMIEQEIIHPYLTRKDFDTLQYFGVLAQDLSYEKGHIVAADSARFSANLDDGQNLEAVSGNCLGERLQNGVVLTGAFFIGPRDFYDHLRKMSDKERQLFEMTGVEVANQLYGGEHLRAVERKDGRFCNTGMKATLLGHVVSDGLEDGTVVSGVGGQYNFVAMAHALKDGRLVMMIKSTRQEKGKVLSNIVYNYGHVTIPRHLRDIVVTEYGIADIRGKCDQDVIKEMLKVTDSRFQDELLAEAKKYNKIPRDYQIPGQYRNNTPERIASVLKPYKAEGHFGPFPFGSEFDLVEMIVAQSLKMLKQKSVSDSAHELGDMIASMPDTPPENAMPMMERMNLAAAETPEEKTMQKTLMAGMRLAGII